MRFTRFVWLGTLAVALQAHAGYAPIPDTELGKDWTIETFASVSRDTNIFGAATGEIASNVFSLTPKISYSGSPTDKAFVSAFYKLAIDHFDNRPGSKTLLSHDLMGRLAYGFSEKTNIDLSDTYSIDKNPEALLPGVVTPVNSDQSFHRNEFDGTFTTAAGPKVNLSAKLRSEVFNYDAARLGADLDRTENLYGLSADFAYQPEIKVVGEYRHQTIDYDTAGGSKDKVSDFLLGGADVDLAKKLTATGRIGGERRRREGERNTTSPYVETTLKYDYADKSYLSAGYVFTYEESSNVALYTDSQVNRFFANVQHLISGPFTASASLDYEPSQLKGRRGVADVNEDTVRLGLGLQYSPSVHWTFSANYDYDNVSSDDANRAYTRNRYGVSARATF